MAYLTEEEIPQYTLVKGVTMKEIDAASFYIDAFKGISFTKQTYKERIRFIKKPSKHNLFQEFRGRLEHFPRIKIDEIYTTIRTPFVKSQTLKFNEEDLMFDKENSPYFSFYPSQKIFWFNPMTSINELFITYEAGYDESNYPEALKRATGLLAGNLKQAGGALQWTSRDDYDVKVTLANNGIFTSEIKDLISSVNLS